MGKKTKVTDELLLQREFKRERLSRAEVNMTAAKLASKGNKKQATSDQLKRKILQLDEGDRDNVSAAIGAER